MRPPATGTVATCYWCRWRGRYMDAHRRSVRWHGVHLSRVPRFHVRRWIFIVVRVQPVQVDDGAFRLHRHVVNTTELQFWTRLYSTWVSSQRTNWLCTNRSLQPIKSWLRRAWICNDTGLTCSDQLCSSVCFICCEQDFKRQKYEMTLRRWQRMTRQQKRIGRDGILVDVWSGYLIKFQVDITETGNARENTCKLLMVTDVLARRFHPQPYLFSKICVRKT